MGRRIFSEDGKNEPFSFVSFVSFVVKIP